jgi:hypothetical protein
MGAGQPDGCARCWAPPGRRSEDRNRHAPVDLVVGRPDDPGHCIGGPVDPDFHHGGLVDRIQQDPAAISRWIRPEVGTGEYDLVVTRVGSSGRAMSGARARRQVHGNLGDHQFLRQGVIDEPNTLFTMMLHLPAMPGHRIGARVKNGPALAGHGAEAVRDAIAAKIVVLPEHLRKSLTWDQGAELAQHAQLRIDTGLAIYFCDPRSPWQRGSNENTNGLLRQYFPKCTDISRYTEDELDAVAATLNGRPRKTLGWRTPAEALENLLR